MSEPAESRGSSIPWELYIGGFGVLALLTIASLMVFSGRSSSAMEASPRILADTFEVTLREGTNIAVALSPDRSTFAMDLQGTLWILPLTGGEARAISDVYGDIRQPDWSPDGSTIAFQSFRAGTWDIWISRPDGSDLRQLTSGPFDDREPHWSPDGSRIIFTSDRGGEYDVGTTGTYDIWEVNVVSGSVRQLTNTASNVEMPAWSPDGRRIAYVSQGGIWLLDEDGSQRVVATAIQGNLAAPSWSPDGRALVYQQGGNVETGLYIVDLDPDDESSEPRRLALDTEDVFPFRVSWISETEFVYTGDGKIKRYDISGGPRGETVFAASVVLVRDQYTPRGRDFDSLEPQRALGIISPMVSPSGDAVVFTALNNLWLLRIGDPQPAQVTDDPYISVSPTWSPDGSHIAYISDRGGSMDVWIRELSTGNERQLTDGPDAAQSPSWSPDGSEIAYIDQRGRVLSTNVSTGSLRILYDRISMPGRPTWSSDGRTIAIAHLSRLSSHFREGVNQFLFIPLDERQPWVFSPEEHASIGPRGNNPVWSPDGTLLAFLMRGMLWVQPVSQEGEPTGPPRQLTTEIADDPSWTGDSRKIVFMALDRMKQIDLETGVIEEIPLELMWHNALPEGRTVVHAGRLFDGLSPDLREHMDIVIDGHRIAAIEPHRDELHVGQVVDASDLTVIPGLFDMHSHMGDGSPADALGRVIGYGEALGRLYLSFGITSVREPSAYPFTARERMESSASGSRLLPRVFFTGGSIDGTRVYYSADHGVESEEQLERELERTRTLGYDLIKTYVRLPDAFQKRVVEFAHQIGIPVSSHEIYPAVAYGVDGVEHVSATSRRGYSPKASALMRTYQDNIELLARSGMYYDLTHGIHGAFDLVILDSPELVADRRVRELTPSFQYESLVSRLDRSASSRENLERRVASQRETIRRVVEQGGRLTTGTDSPVIPYGIAAIAEIESFAAAGITPFKALEAATRNAAESIGMGDDLGTLEVGKLADLVAVEGNPLENIRDIRRTRYVMKNGVVHEPDSLLRRP